MQDENTNPMIFNPPLNVALNVNLPNCKVKETDASSIDENIVEEFRKQGCNIEKFWLTPVDVYCYHDTTLSYVRIMLP